MSADQTYNFWRLYGDYYGEGTVGADDDALLSADYGYTSSSSHYLWYMDVNDDGVINFPDLLALSQNYNHSYTVTTAGPIWIGASTTEGVGSGMILESLLPRDFYYTSQWQVIQETANNPGTGGMQTADQYVWGLAYVNELVLRDADSDGSSSTGNYGISGSGLDQRLYALQDANYNVTALVGLVSGTWSVVERFTYTPYGTQTVLNASGAQTTDGYNWSAGYQGEFRDSVTGLYHMDLRDYDPETGTWTTQDPTGYLDGANLYQAYRSNPIIFHDPSGLLSSTASPGGGIGGVIGGIIGGIIGGAIGAAGGTAAEPGGGTLIGGAAGGEEGIIIGGALGSAAGAAASAAGQALAHAGISAGGAILGIFTSRGKNDNEYSEAAKRIKQQGGDPCCYLDGLYKAARAADDQKTAQKIKMAQKILGCRQSR